MKLAVLSDVHGNLPALEVVLEDIDAWAPDKVIVNGDFINRGPNNDACFRLITPYLTKWCFIKGNHEEFVQRSAVKRLEEGDGDQMRQFAYWTLDQLGSDMDHVEGWLDHIDLDHLDGGSVHITHGSRLGNRDGIRPETSDLELVEKVGDPSDLFIVSHTHKPLQRRLNGNLVVNTGSVGSPFDGDRRPAYGRFTYSQGRWQGQIVRLDYDYQRALREFVESGFLDGGGALTRLMLLELEQARGHMGPWMRDYEQLVRSGQLTVSEAVQTYLDAKG